MSRGKTHYRTATGESAACGDKKITPAWSTHIAEMVTCKRCKRTKLFRHY